MLEVRDLQVSYGDIQALFGVSFTLQQGHIMALLGANGAGKTTVLKAVSGLLRPKAGEIWFEGKRIDGLSPFEVAEFGIAHAPEGRRVFPNLTVEENLIVGSVARRAKPSRATMLTEVYEMFPRLLERRHQLSGSLSGGEQQMLAIGRALMLKPKLLMLDEPSLGLAPLLVEAVFERIRAIANLGITILLVEQNANACLTTAQEGCVLQQGRVVYQGTQQELLGSRLIQEAYLGA